MLVYPLTEVFDRALPVLDFPHASELRLWVIPFCMKTRMLKAPSEGPFATILLQAV